MNKTLSSIVGEIERQQTRTGSLKNGSYLQKLLTENESTSHTDRSNFCFQRRTDGGKESQTDVDNMHKNFRWFYKVCDIISHFTKARSISLVGNIFCGVTLLFLVTTFVTKFSRFSYYNHVL